MLPALASAWAAKKPRPAQMPAISVPPLELEGGRKLEFLRAFSSEQEVKAKKSIFSRVLDFVIGAPEVHRLVRPYGVTTDSQGRILVTDPGALLVHIFDFSRQRYSKLEGGKEPFRSPIGIAVDAKDNIYVTDSEVGKVFVFDARGKFRRFIGDIKGEAYFKRPTGIAVDSAHDRIYITDTLRHAVFVCDLAGNVLRRFGQHGAGDGEFNLPTEVLVRGDEIVVVDAMNFRLQFFDERGNFRAKFGALGVHTGSMFRSKGIAADSEGNFYVADAFLDLVQVFDRSGNLLYFFGQNGGGAEQFQLPAGVHIDRQDTVYVVDSYNRRVQMFRYTANHQAAERGGTQ